MWLGKSKILKIICWLFSKDGTNYNVLNLNLMPFLLDLHLSWEGKKYILFIQNIVIVGSIESGLNQLKKNQVYEY